MWQQVPDNMSPTSVCDLFSHASQKRQRYLAVYYHPVMVVPWLLMCVGGALVDRVHGQLDVVQIRPGQGNSLWLVHFDLPSVRVFDIYCLATLFAAAAAAAGAAACGTADAFGRC